MDTEDLSYSTDHEWVRIDEDNETAYIGVTDYAAQQLGDVVYVDLPAEGDLLTAGETMGEIESTKSVSDLFAPVSGRVLEVNQEVVDSPETVNADPFEAGWLLRVAYDELPDSLLDHDQYKEFIAE